MYSRDIFPKYTSGGMPIPENYSGNAIRRTPPPRQTPPPRTATSPTSSTPRASVPLTVSPSFDVRQNPIDMPREQGTPVPQAESVAREERAEAMHREDERGRAVEQQSVATEKKAESGSAPIPTALGGGLTSLLSTLLPPKPGVGGLFSQIGLEEALLLGLFLLLSQSDEEEDTLLLLALLFLYR